MGNSTESAGFSLTDCGPVDRMLARIGLQGPGSPSHLARAVVPALLIWIPLLAMAFVLPPEGEAAAITFFEDLTTHV